MAEFVDPFGTVPNGFVDPFSAAPAEATAPLQSSGLRRAVADPAISLARGIIGVPEAIVGLADIPTLGGAGKAAEALGFRPREAKEFLGEFYSPEYKQTQQELQATQGFFPTIQKAIEKPSIIAHGLIESLPSIGAGGALARGALAAAPRLGFAGAGAVGEGAVSAGATAEQIRQQSKTGYLTPAQSMIAAVSGGTTGAVTAAGAKLANKFGLVDVEQVLAGKSLGQAAGKGAVRRVAEGFATEGAEELLQSAQEQLAQNIALGQELGMGVGQAAALGMLTGGLLGGGVQLVRGQKPEAAGTPPTEQPPSPEPAPATEAPPAPPAGPAEPLSMAEFIRSTHVEAERAPMGVTEFVRSRRPAGVEGPVKAKEVKAAKAEYDAYRQAFLAGQQAEYEAYKQAFIDEQFGTQPLTPEQRNQIIINQTPTEAQVPAPETAVEPVQKTRIAEPAIIGEQPAPVPAAPIITAKEAELLRIAEKETGYAPDQVEVQRGVQRQRGEGAARGQAPATGTGDRVLGATQGEEGRAQSVETKVALLKRQRGELLTNREAKLVRDYEKAAPAIETPAVQTQPRFRGRQFGSAERRENFVNAYSSAVDTALADLTAQGVVVTPNKLRRAASLLKRSAEAAVTAKDDAAGATILDEAMGKALRGIIPKAEVEVFRQKLADATQAALPETLNSRAAVDAAIIAKSDEIVNTIAGMVGTPKDLVVEAAPRVAGGAGMIQFGQLRDVITVSLQASDAGSVAAHEGFHYLDKRVLTGPERRVVRQAFASGSRLHRMLVAKAEAYDAANGTDITSEIRAIPAEARAYGFEFWRRGELEAQGMIAKVFQKLARVMERIRNYIDGLGFTSYEDLFAMIRRGEYAKRDLSGIREFEREAMTGLPLFSKAAKLPQTETPEFKAWFGDSKVVDAEGKPLVVYHSGTFDENENPIPDVGTGGFHFGTKIAAEMRDIGKRVDDAITGIAVEQAENEEGVLRWYWSADGMDSYDVVGEEGFGSKAEAQTSAERFVVDMDFSGTDPMPITQAYLSIRNPLRMPDQKDSWVAAVAKAKRLGHDGIVYRNEFEDKGEDSYIVFSPTQIKSAIGNRGTFDPNDPNILYSKAATESIQDIGRRFAEGDLQREQVNAYLAGQLDRPDMRDLSERLIEKAGVEVKTLGNSLRRIYHGYVGSGLNRARASQGYANVFGVMTHFIQRKAIIFERAIAKDLSTWVKGATKQDKVAVSKAMLEATVRGLARDSAEYHSLMQPLTQDQRAMADQAWTMIGKMLDAEFVAEQAKYRKLFADDAKFNEWFENRKVQVEQLKRNSYFPERRYGDHFVHAYVTAPDGKPITVYYEQYEREAGALEAKAELDKIFAAEGLKVDYGFKHKVEYDGSISIGQFLDLAQRHGIALTQVEKERLGKALIAADSTRRNRLFRRQNVAGYSQDGMRVLAEFAVSMSNKIAYSEMGDALQDALQGRQVDVAFTKEGTVAINTQADTNLWKLDGPDAGFFRNLADEKVGFVMSPESRSTVSNKLRALAVIYFLGGSIAAAGVNLSSLPMITFPWLTQHASPAKASAMLLEGMRLAGKHFNDIRDLPTLLGTKPLEGIDNVEGLRHALQIAAQDGSLFDTEIYQFMGLSRGQEYSLSGRTQEAVKLWMTPFRLAEQYNRVSAYIAAYKVAKSNNLDNEAAAQQAQEAVYGTQFRYDEANRPALADSGVGSLFFVFKSFPIFMMETMTFLAKTNPKSAVFMLGMLVLMAGVEGLPFAEDLEDLIDVLAQRLFGEPFNSKRWLRNTLKNASEAVVGADLSGVLMHGVANTLTGLNFASRVGAGNLIPGTRIGAADSDYRRAMDEILGPVGGMVSGMVEGADALSKGDFMEAAKKGLPLAAKNAVKGWEQFEKGYATDAGGRKLVDVGSWEAFWQSLGFSSSALSQVYESDTIDRRTVAFYNGIKTQFTKEMVAAIRDGDREAANEVGQAVMAWNQAHPDMPIAMSPAGLRRQVALAGMPLNQRTLLTMPRYLRGQSEAAIGLAAE